MMNIETFADEIANTLKNDENLKEVEIIRAYPDAAYSGRLKSSVVAMGVSKAEITPAEIDGDGKEAEISIYADVYVPENLGVKRAVEIVNEICSVCMDYNIACISAQKAYYDDAVQAIAAKTIIKFNTEYLFGGESGE